MQLRARVSSGAHESGDGGHHESNQRGRLNNNMDIIPAIDIKSGKCVRLQQGRDDATTEYSDDPVAVARRWVREGARRIHVVNLDGAFGRTSQNLAVLESICRSVNAEVQFGGGLRSCEAMEAAFASGARRIVLGTVAIENPGLLASALSEFGSESIVVALDASEGRLATHGWTLISNRTVYDVARELFGGGVREILYTDITRDGMLTGPDLPGLRQLGSIGVRVLASGGVSSVDDIRSIAALKSPWISGAIVGKALYEGRTSLPDLIEAARSADGKM